MELPVGFMICGVFAEKPKEMTGKDGVLLQLKGVMSLQKKLKQLEVN